MLKGTGNFSVPRFEGRASTANAAVRHLSKASEAHSIFELHLGGKAPNTLIALNNVANAQKALEQWDEAISRYNEIISKRQAIGTRQPKDFSNLTNLGGAHCNLANLLLARKQYELASQRYERAIKVLESVVEASSLNRAKLFLGFTNVGYADALRQLGRHSESLAANERACSLLSSDHHQFVLGLSKCATLAADGQDELALDQLESLLEDHTADAEQWYEAARVYAIAFHVKADDEQPASERQPRSGHYAARALDLLKKVRDEGHFRDAKNIASLQRDEDFMALRKLEEFETFLHSLSD